MVLQHFTPVLAMVHKKIIMFLDKFPSSKHFPVSRHLAAFNLHCMKHSRLFLLFQQNMQANHFSMNSFLVLNSYSKEKLFDN